MARFAWFRVAAVASGAVWLLAAGGWQRPAAGQAAEPRNPGAVTSCPAWLKSGAPFDMAAFFAEPPAGKDAAPLYFTTFAEFGPEVDACLPPPEKGRGRDRRSDGEPKTSPLSATATSPRRRRGSRPGRPRPRW